MGSSSSSSIVSRTILSRLRLLVPLGSRSAAEKRRDSYTVDASECTPNCSTYPIILMKVASSFGAPLTKMPPLILPCVLRLASTSNSVVLPAPDEPMSAVILHGSA